MKSRAKLLGHLVHQMLIVLPPWLLAMAVLFDLLAIGLSQGDRSEIAYWMIAAGVVTGLRAALLRHHRLARHSLRHSSEADRRRLHGIGNVLVVMLFAVSWVMRGDAPATPGGVALTLSLAGACLALFTGWLGGEPADRLGVGVDDGAHVDAPSLLTRPRVRR